MAFSLEKVARKGRMRVYSCATESLTRPSATLSRRREMPRGSLICDRCSSDSLLSPLLRSQAGSKDAALSPARDALCGRASSKSRLLRSAVRQHARNRSRRIFEIVARTRPRIVAIYEDNFNFLSKMCLSRMREIAFGMIDVARRVAQKLW